MNRHAHRTVLSLLLSLLVLAASLAAQGRGPTALDRMHEAFQQERLKLIEKGAGFEEQRKLAAAFADRLAAFLPKAEGTDRFNGRLMLVDYRLILGERDAAVATLKDIDVETAPALVLAAAAEFATHLQLDDEREQWIEAALAKDTPFEERMALGMQLMTRLQAVDRGEGVFDDARRTARDDEARAKVEWFWAMALREREDLPETAHEEALKGLAEAYPKTYFGGVAKDRLRARELKPGHDAVPFSMRTVDGETLSSEALRGKVIALHFWTSWSGDCDAAAPHLAKLHRDLEGKGLVLITVSMDFDCEIAQQVARQQGATWPLVCEGRGPQTDLALRYAVDGPPRLLILDRAGKIASLRHYPFDDSGAEALRKAVEAALAQVP